MPTTYTLRHITFDDFKKIKHVDQALNGAVTCIGGKNAQGKSTVLAGIDVLLGGAKFLPEDPIRTGADRAVLKGIVETPIGQIHIVREVRTVDGKPKVYTTVSGGAGMESTAPQRLLDELVGAGTRDALAFLSMKPRDQVDELQRLLGLNFEAVNRRRQEAYDKRTGQNAVVDTLAKRFQGVQGVPAGTPDEELSAAELTAELQEAAKHNAEGEQLEKELTRLAQQLADCDAWLETSSAEIAAEEETILAAEAELRRRRQALEARSTKHLDNVGKRRLVEQAVKDAKAEARAFEPIDTEDLRRRLAAVDETNANVRLKKDLVKAKAEWEAAKALSDKLTSEIEACDKEKRDRIGAAKMPVEGLGFTDDGVTYRGLSLNSASDAEKRVVAVGLAFAAQADLKVKSIRDGSLLDEDALRHVAELVEQYGGQLIVERVGYGAENSFILEEGEEIDPKLLAQRRAQAEIDPKLLAQRRSPAEVA